MNDPTQVLAALTLLQTTTFWIALRVAGTFWFGKRCLRGSDTSRVPLFSTGDQTLDRYLFFSSLTICAVTALIVSMVLNNELSRWTILPIFGVVVGTDVSAIYSMRPAGVKLGSDPVKTLFEKLDSRR
ncbi:hypothetical protein GCM10019059_43680 [Camelimonas fluminis]|uniref:Uncharacterized protein n=1 Tax=Camelimonas fluminis TaxID=1576911 RepID=A0ABV7UI24_9HYPH|nr:hypothetical protein [Camelimonas fluminis]GHE80835.1 hypothetical protein GCM10019059_43680 [Camelimonas fluminis]